MDSQVQLSRKIIVILLLISISMSFQLGCSDPSQIGRFRATPATNIILDSLGVVDEEPEQFADAREQLREERLEAAQASDTSESVE